jgi:DNA polymerase I-like protein with 3'-5' exonuclease and polymerase domains
MIRAGYDGSAGADTPDYLRVSRDRRYRACFAAPTGRVLVKADYSQIELRLAAKIADESRMLAAYRAGQDSVTVP